MDSWCTVSSLLPGASSQTSREANASVLCPPDSWTHDRIAQRDPGMLGAPGRMLGCFHTPEVRQQRGRVGPSRAVFESPEPHTRFLTSALKLLWMRSILANWLQSVHLLGFPGGARGKEPACQCRRHKKCEFNPWVGKIPRRRAWQLSTYHGGWLQGLHEQMDTALSPGLGDGSCSDLFQRNRMADNTGH